MFDRYICVYCGENAESLDHIIPQNYKGYYNRSYNQKYVVPSCQECNSTLSDKFLHTISERTNYLWNKYNKKYKKHISWKKWEKEDLKELGYNLKSMIIEENNNHDEIIKRLNHLLYISQINPSIDDIWLDIDGKP